MFENTERAPLLVTLRQAERLLAVKATKLNELCNEGVIERRHVGRRAVVTLASIKAYVPGLAW